MCTATGAATTGAANTGDATPLAEIAPALVKGRYNVVDGAIRKP